MIFSTSALEEKNLRYHMLTKHILLSLVSPGLSTDTFMAIYDPEMTSECSFEEKTHFTVLVILRLPPP